MGVTNYLLNEMILQVVAYGPMGKKHLQPVSISHGKTPSRGLSEGL